MPTGCKYVSEGVTLGMRVIKEKREEGGNKLDTVHAFYPAVKAFWRGT